ncbi:hypothetical protein BGZ60DRAFT_531241 [Tricladium varicosporioides]|nr:hypothetical protein BGZ60DRAFT_531241 [Hymenoscyphus varicosporioides]
MKFSCILSTAACLTLSHAVPATETKATEILATNPLVDGRGEYPNNKVKTGENYPSINVTFIDPDGNIVYTKVPTLLGRPHTFSHPANVSEVKIDGRNGYEFDKHCRLYAMDGPHHTTQIGTTDYYRLDKTAVLTSICCTSGNSFDYVERSIEILNDNLNVRSASPPGIIITLILYNGTEVESKTVPLDGVGVIFDYPAAISEIKVSDYQFNHFCQVSGTDTTHPASQTGKDIYRLDYPCIVKSISCKSAREYYSSVSSATYLPTPKYTPSLTYKPFPMYSPNGKITPDAGKTMVHVTFVTETHNTHDMYVYANNQEEALSLPGRMLSAIVPDYEFDKFCQLKGPEGVLVVVKEKVHMDTYYFHHPSTITSIRCNSNGWSST